MKKFTAGIVLGSQLLLANTLATVNGEKITDQDILPIVAQLSQGKFATLDPTTQKRVENLALEQAIAQILVEKEAEKDLLKDKEFKNKLDIAITQYQRQIIYGMWMEREFEKIAISTKELKDYYNSNRNEFEQVRASHILLETEEEAKAIITSLSRYSGDRLKGEFANYAKNLSKGPSGKNGGDLGYFGRGQMVPAFNDTVFSMKEGELTKTPVKTQFGYHVIHLTEQKFVSFAEAKPFIEQKLKVDKFKGFVEDKINQLKKKARIREY
ncbi:parvulin-like peptidyl-prolyl isomerase [Thiovulum sp. ES]|nr:parvulin-like peptidyl-prolyl isomerase [Thiovulum sp. ES]